MPNSLCPRVVSVVGGGFVGLHTAVMFALRSFTEKVIVIDVNENVVRRIREGKDSLHIREKYVLDNWGVASKKIEATTNYADAGDSEVFVVAVQTPFNGEKIDYSPLENAGNKLGEIVKKNSLIVSEVTIYPGGTMNHLGKPLEDKSNLKLDLEIYLAHAPERLTAGSTKWTPEKIPRVIGGIGPNSLKKASMLYHDCLGIEIYPVGDIRVAEAAKLLENSFRLLNISFINELKRSLDKMGVNIRDVVKAASTKPFGYMPFYPSPYAGGACLPKDSFMMESFTRSELLGVARKINESQPLYYAANIQKIIAKKNYRNILFYGFGFKPGSPYSINSPILRIIKELQSLNSSIAVKKYDPLISSESDFETEDEAVAWADFIIKWGYIGKKFGKPFISIEEL